MKIIMKVKKQQRLMETEGQGSRNSRKSSLLSRIRMKSQSPVVLLNNSNRNFNFYCHSS